MTNESRLEQVLARRLRAEMEHLGLSARKITARGGPSGPTLTAILNGEGARADSLSKLDDALDWEQGSALGVLRGEEPRRKTTNSIAIEDALAVATPEQLVHEIAQRLGATLDVLWPSDDNVVAFDRPAGPNDLHPEGDVPAIPASDAKPVKRAARKPQNRAERRGE